MRPTGSGIRESRRAHLDVTRETIERRLAEDGSVKATGCYTRCTCGTAARGTLAAEKVTGDGAGRHSSYAARAACPSAFALAKRLPGSSAIAM